jgi:hypothetical protein
MNTKELYDEFEQQGRLLGKSIQLLKNDLSRTGDTPLSRSAIAVATDCGVWQLIPDVAKYLDSDVPSLRWQAVCSIIGRFRDTRYAEKALEMIRTDEDYLVKPALLASIGELLPLLDSRELQVRIADLLWSTFKDLNTAGSLRDAAYGGIVAAMDVPPTARPSAARRLDLSTEADAQLLDGFYRKYCDRAQR